MSLNLVRRVGAPYSIAIALYRSQAAPIPGIPEWADWFANELDTHHALIPALGIGCSPVIIKGDKENFLDWLSWGVESGAITLPTPTGSIRWPRVSLQDIFPRAE